MSLRDAAAQFARLYPVHPDTQPAAGWEGNCALLMARFGYAPGGVGWAVEPRAFGNAIDVANNSGPLNKNPAAAPVGAWHFWNWGIDGHVGNDLTGGGNDVFMASSFLRESWGTHIGVNSVASYNAANRSATYLGWATNYRGGRYNVPAGTASTGSTPLEEDDMFQDSDRALLMDLAAAIGAGNARLIPVQDQTQQSVLAHVRATLPIVEAIRAAQAQPIERTVNGNVVTVSQLQDNADTNTMVRQLLTLVAAPPAPAGSAPGPSGADIGTLTALIQQVAAKVDSTPSAIVAQLGAALTNGAHA